MEHSVIWSPGTTLESLEQIVIMKAYRFYQKNKTATANSLGISIRTLDHKLEKFEQDSTAQEALSESRRKDREYQLARARGHTPETGVRLESVAEVTSKQVVPMPERAEVQEMLSPNLAAGGSKRGR